MPTFHQNKRKQKASNLKETFFNSDSFFFIKFSVRLVRKDAYIQSESQNQRRKRAESSLFKAIL